MSIMLKEEVFNQPTIVCFDRFELDIKDMFYRFNGEFIEIHPSELPKLKEKLGEVAFNTAMEISKGFGFDTIIFSEDDFQDTFNPFQARREKQ